MRGLRGLSLRDYVLQSRSSLALRALNAAEGETTLKQAGLSPAEAIGALRKPDSPVGHGYITETASRWIHRMIKSGQVPRDEGQLAIAGCGHLEVLSRMLPLTRESEAALAERLKREAKASALTQEDIEAMIRIRKAHPEAVPEEAVMDAVGPLKGLIEVSNGGPNHSGLRKLRLARTVQGIDDLISCSEVMDS